MKKNWTKIINLVFDSEGGYVDHPVDPGGATNYGITIGTLSGWRGYKVTKQQVKDLGKTEAAAIYNKNYWQKVWGDDMPSGFDYAAMDGAVNSGVSRGVRWVQKAVGAKPDGVMGPKTLKRIEGASALQLQQAVRYRLGFLQGLSTWKTFGKGWGKRIAKVDVESQKLYVADRSDGAKKGILSGLKDINLSRLKKSKKDRNVVVTSTGTGGASVSAMPALDGSLPIEATAIGVALTGIVVLGLYKHFKTQIEYGEEVETLLKKEI